MCHLPPPVGSSKHLLRVGVILLLLGWTGTVLAWQQQSALYLDLHEFPEIDVEVFSMDYMSSGLDLEDALLELSYQYSYDPSPEPTAPPSNGVSSAFPSAEPTRHPSTRPSIAQPSSSPSRRPTDGFVSSPSSTPTAAPTLQQPAAAPSSAAPAVMSAVVTSSTRIYQSRNAVQSSAASSLVACGSRDFYSAFEETVEISIASSKDVSVSITRCQSSDGLKRGAESELMRRHLSGFSGIMIFYNISFLEETNSPDLEIFQNAVFATISSFGNTVAIGSFNTLLLQTLNLSADSGVFVDEESFVVFTTTVVLLNGQSPTTAPTPAPHSKHEKQSSNGSVLGLPVAIFLVIVCGGCCLLILCGMAGFVWWRRRQGELDEWGMSFAKDIVTIKSRQEKDYYRKQPRSQESDKHSRLANEMMASPFDLESYDEEEL